MGYPRDLAANYLQTQDVHNFTMEAMIRNPGRGMSTRVGDGVLYGEWYIRVDSDGDGVAELRYICTMGEDHDIVRDEPANRIKVAAVQLRPDLPHPGRRQHRGSDRRHPADQNQHDARRPRQPRRKHQPARPSSTSWSPTSTTPSTTTSARSSAPGATRSAAVQFATTPFVGQQALPVLEYLDAVQQRRTGLSDAARGLDPKALQSSTQIGVEAIINGQQERTELVARVLAETGYQGSVPRPVQRDRREREPARTLRINGKWQAYDTSMFDADMSVEVNPTLGKGSRHRADDDACSRSRTTRLMVFQQFGPHEPGRRHPRDAQHHHRHAGPSPTSKTSAATSRRRRPQVLQQMQTAPKEPDAMTIAAKANYERVKMQTAKARGRPAVRRPEGGGQDEAFRQKKLAQEAGLRRREDPRAGGAARPRPSGRHGQRRRRHGQGGDHRPDRRRQRAATARAAACRKAKTAVFIQATDEVVTGTTWLPMITCRRWATLVGSRT